MRTTKTRGFKVAVDFIIKGEFENRTETSANRTFSSYINKVILIEYYAREEGWLIDLHNKQAAEDDNANIVLYKGKWHLSPEENLFLICPLRRLTHHAK
jgi:hypothetical protein